MGHTQKDTYRKREAEFLHVTLTLYGSKMVGFLSSGVAEDTGGGKGGIPEIIP